MKKALFFIPLLVLIACSGDSEITPGDTFIKYFGGDGKFELKDMILRGDGTQGVVMLGAREGDDNNGGIRRDGYIVETDASGNVINEFILALTDENGDETFFPFESSRITAIPGGYLVVGSNLTQFGGSIAAWAQLNSDMEMVD